MTQSTYTPKYIRQCIREAIPGYDAFHDWPKSGFDERRAMLAIEFFCEHIKHVKGKAAGQPYYPQPHETAIIASLFGFRMPNDLRRFRWVFELVARKNSKSTRAAGIALAVAVLEPEPGGELYTTAASQEQARVIFEIIFGGAGGESAPIGMVQADEFLSEICERYQNHGLINGQKFRPLPATAQTAHGLNPSMVINDELHARKNRALVDAMQTGMGARAQPLRLDITTSDFERDGSICNEIHDYARKVRDRLISAPTFLPAIFEADPEKVKADGDYWKTDDAIREANPLLGHSVSMEFLESERSKAIESPAFRPEYQRLYLNIRTASHETAIDMDAWLACGGALDLNDFVGQQALGAGLDIGNTSDLTSLCLLFKADPEKYPREIEVPDGNRHPNLYAAFWWHWMPKGTAEQRERDTPGALYSQWAEQGWVKLTGGRETAYDVVAEDIEALAQRFGIEKLAIDRNFQGAHLGQNLTARGLTIEAFGQGFASMAAPTKELMRMIGRGSLLHGDNPCIAWQAAHLQVETDAAGNMKPSKQKSYHKIDGMVACVEAIAMSAVTEFEQEYGPSVYDNEDVLIL